MKKTLVALAVASLATSASALTVYDNGGTNVQFDGSLRLILSKETTKERDANGVPSAIKGDHSNLRNAGTRFGVRVKHNIAEDFYALGRLELRFDRNTQADQFGDVYAKRAYVGLGSKQYGELTFGRQLTIADDYGLTDDYEYGIVPSYIATSGTQVVRYDYKGIEGLQIGANYNFAEDRGTSRFDPNQIYEVPVGKSKNAFGFGAVYETELANGHKFNVEGGYGRSNFVTGANYKHYQDGYEASLGYTIGDLALVGDFGYKYEKDGAKRTKAFYVAPGFQYQVVPTSKVYGNYLYERLETTQNKADSSKEKTHGFLLGVDYKLHKQVVTFVEGKYVRTKDYAATTAGYDYTGKKTDKAIGVGMRVYW